MAKIDFSTQGIHEIICGDCIDVMRTFPENKIDLAITSPPYNIGIDYESYCDSRPWSEYFDWCKEWMFEVHRVLKKDGRFCLNHYFSLGTSKERVAPLMRLENIAEEIGFHHHSVAFWTDITRAKYTAWGSWLSASAPYLNSPFEGILILYKDQWKRQNKGESTIKKEEFIEACGGVWNLPSGKRKNGVPTFPTDLPRRCINLLSYRDDIILDPFNGTGSTTLAAHQTGRNFIGIDVDTMYCNVARERIRNGR